MARDAAMMPVRNDRIARLVELTSADREAQTLEELCQRMTCRIDGVEGPEGRPETVAEICAAWDVPYGRVMEWLMADAKRYARYERALEMRAHELVAQCLDIADGSDFPQNKRVRIDTRFRTARHHAPEKYGERMQVEGSNTLVLMDAGLIGRAATLLERLSQGRTIEHDVTPEDDEGEI